MKSSKLTLDDIRTAAARLTEDATHREITMATGSYRSMPLPTDDGSYSMSMGGNYRYLFHDEGLIEVEYINGNGVVREAYFGGIRIARSFTPKGASA